MFLKSYEIIKGYCVWLFPKQIRPHFYSLPLKLLFKHLQKSTINKKDYFLNKTTFIDYCLQVFRLGMIHDENWVVYLCNVGSAAQSMFPCDQGPEDAYTREV